MTEQSLIERLAKLKAEQYADNDIASARLVSDLFPEFFYCAATRGFWSYDGKRYVEDKEGLFIQTALKSLAICYPKYIVGLTNLSDDERNRLLKQSARWQSLRYREKILRDMKPNRQLDFESLDTDKYMINLQNGAMCLERFNVKFLPHTSDQRFSKIANVSFDQYAKCPLWLHFLRDITLGDKAQEKYLQKLAGLSLTGETKLEKVWFFHGASTRNGKTTFCETLVEILGDYSITVKPETLCTKRFSDGAAASPDIARMRGARFIVCSEFAKGSHLDSSCVKLISGNDTISARKLYAEATDFKVQAKIVFNTNWLPTISDSTLFTSDRVCVVPFNRHLTEKERDINLKDKLLKEKPGIFLWMLEGLKLYYAEGLGACESVSAATKDYEVNSDKIAAFIEECLVQVDHGCVSCADVYREYETWCRSNTYALEGSRLFKQELIAKGLWKATGTIGGLTKKNVIPGYRLKA